MTGILSLADSLLGMSMQSLVASLSLRDKVLQALLYREGMLGDLLAQTELAECREAQAPLPTLEADNFNQVQLEALEWVRKMWSDDFLT
jgi:EAL and modified HD-GYP domain-containing signal transduction protein